MNNFSIGLLSMLLVAGPAMAATNSPGRVNGEAVQVSDSSDEVDKEYRKIMADDDEAQAEVDKWIIDAKGESGGFPNPQATLKMRIRQRFEPVRKAYESFLQRHPEHARARLAYGSFLNDMGEEELAAEQWEKARELDPKNPAAWNNLANYYGHRSPVKKAFEYYAKAIELNPQEPTYYWNLATTVYLFRKDAQEYYTLSEREVFDKALELYRKAMKLDPTNFILASDYANSFYGTKPPRLEEGLAAWENALKLARDDIEREGVYIHLARIKWKLGRLEEARKHLDAVTHPMYKTTRDKLRRNIDEAQLPSSTNSVSPKK